MKFNFFNKSKQEMPTIVNYEGAASYVLTPELELYTAVVTAGLSDSFYEKADTRVARIRELMQKTNPEYTAQLAIYTRDRMYMRSVPMVLALELAKANSGNAVVSKAVAGVVKRADEITELLAYYQMANERTGTKRLNKLSKQVQKGLCVAFNRFDEYQFAKYNSDASVKLRDALFLVHPKAKDETQQLLFNKIADNTLAVPYTWETQLSAVGQVKYADRDAKAAAIKAKWEELIDSGKVGYMAMLRNLRNILDAEVSAEHVKKVCMLLSDSQAVANAKQMPFRFLSAYREVINLKSEYVPMVLAALGNAVAASAANLQGFDAKTGVVIACDVSGSMQKPISPRSGVQLFDIGLVLGMLLYSKCERAIAGMFGDSWKEMNMDGGNVLAEVMAYHRREGEVGYATNGYKVIDYLANQKIGMDKIMIFTDCQLWSTSIVGSSLARSWNRYKKMYPKAKLYLFDLAGYGQSPVNLVQQDVYLIAGWSDKIFDVLHAIDNGSDAVEQIKQVKL